MTKPFRRRKACTPPTRLRSVSWRNVIELTYGELLSTKWIRAMAAGCFFWCSAKSQRIVSECFSYEPWWSALASQITSWHLIALSSIYLSVKWHYFLTEALKRQLFAPHFPKRLLSSVFPHKSAFLLLKKKKIIRHLRMLISKNHFTFTRSYLSVGAAGFGRE